MTVDDELLRELKEQAHRRGVSVKAVTNEALRAGLRAMNQPPPPAPYTCPTRSMGRPRACDLDQARELVEALEVEEVSRKLALRK